MKSQIYIVLVVLGLLSACTSTKQTQSTEPASPALLTFTMPDNSTDVVTKAEFERVYAKNNGGPKVAATHFPKEYKEYLDLYINFKRKVYAAEAQGLDTTRAFKSEFEVYRGQLAEPYLRAKEVEEKLVEEAIKRSQYAVKASHLLVKVLETAAPADTLAAYNKIMLYRDSVANGKIGFAELAERVSEDPSAKQNRGNLGYFTAFDMVYEFEEAAFTTPVGSISQPIRTQYGYHLINVDDKIETGGAKRAAHIMVRIGDRYSAKDSTQAIARINELYAKLKSGDDFAKLAQQYSDDPSSAGSGGDLGNKLLIPAMEEVKIKLRTGDFSRPFKTPYGWHILKVTESERDKAYEERLAEVRNRVSRDTRSQLSRDAMLERIKSEYNFMMNEANVNAFKEILNADFPRGTWKPKADDASLLTQTLFTLNNSAKPKSKDTPLLSISLNDLALYYRQKRLRFNGLNPFQAADQAITQFVNEELIAYEETRLPEKYPEYRHLLREYRDGILLFSLMEEKVWRRAVEDTTGLEAFYSDNKRTFFENRSIDAVVYRSSSLTTLTKVQSMLAQGMSDSAIDSVLNTNSALSLTIRERSFEDGKDDIDPKLFSELSGYVAQPAAIEGGSYRIIKVTGTRPAGVKPFERARPEAITKYQDYLEQEWLKDLGYRYPVQISDEVFDGLFKK
ncbi:MAG: peptidylprolyl isomerase [Bacteroidia bacterium]